jgi:hypothetical protein
MKKKIQYLNKLENMIYDLSLDGKYGANLTVVNANNIDEVIKCAKQTLIDLSSSLLELCKSK